MIQPNSSVVDAAAVGAVELSSCRRPSPGSSTIHCFVKSASLIHLSFMVEWLRGRLVT